MAHVRQLLWFVWVIPLDTDERQSARSGRTDRRWLGVHPPPPLSCLHVDAPSIFNLAGTSAVETSTRRREAKGDDGQVDM